jgi:hypothetical protein
MAAEEPSGDGVVQFVEMASEKMVGVIDEDELIFAGQRSNEFSDSALGAMLIIGAVDEELGLCAVPKIREIGAVDGNAEPNQFAYARVCAAHPKANPASKTETGEKQGDVREFRGEKTDGGLDVTLLALTAVVRSGAKSRAAKIESQDGKAKGIQGFGGLIDNLVVEGAAEERVWMADDGRERSRGRPRWSPENGLQSTNWPVKKEIAGIVGNAHKRPAKVYLKGADWREGAWKRPPCTIGEKRSNSGNGVGAVLYLPLR